MKFIIFLFGFFLLPLTVFLDNTNALERFDIVTTEQMKQLLEKREVGEADFLLVNTLDEIIYRSMSIPGSVNVPWYKVDQLQNRLGADKNKLIVTY